MNDWIEKDGYATCLQASGESLDCSGTEVHLIRFEQGKFCHYHKETTEFFHVTKGRGRVLLDGRERRLSAGTSLVIKPHVKHAFINDSPNQFLEAVLVKTNTHSTDTFVV